MDKFIYIGTDMINYKTGQIIEVPNYTTVTCVRKHKSTYTFRYNNAVYTTSNRWQLVQATQYNLSVLAQIKIEEDKRVSAEKKYWNLLMSITSVDIGNNETESADE